MLRVIFRKGTRMSFITEFFGHPRNRKNRCERPARYGRTTRLAFEPLESRLLLANVTTLQFNIPPETADLGVQLGLYSNVGKIYLDPMSHSFQPVSGVSLNLPLFTLAEPSSAGQSRTAPVQYELAIPAGQDVKSGELFLFVGQVHVGLAVSEDGTVAAPKAAPNPAVANMPDNFAQFEFNYQTTGSGAGLDIDISAVDSTGYPFTLVYPASANLPFPLNPLGITLNQTDLNVNFRKAFEAAGEYEQYPEFVQCATFAQQQDPTSLQVVAPQDILAVEAAPPILNSATPTVDQDSQLAPGASYSFCITAISDNLIAGSGGVVGESLVSNSITVSDLTAGNSIALSWNPYYDPNTAGYNIYRYSTTDGAAPTNSTAYNLIARVLGATTTTYVDQGAIPQAQQISADTANSYGFNPLSEYYTQGLLDFFDYYSAPNSFAIRRNGALWVGNSVSYTPTATWNATGETYTVLQLTAQNSVAGTTIQAGDVVNIYRPIFASNTRFVLASAPAMPPWMIAGADAHESPAQMVFGCDAAFASDAHDPDVAGNADLATALAAIENSIVSAFNRGIAADFTIPPGNWASFPQMLDYPAVSVDASSQVAAVTTYYYAVTAVNVYGETTPSLEVAATLHSGEVATLNWSNGENAAPAVAYKVYRGTSPDDLTWLYTTVDGGETSYTDVGAPSPAGFSPPNQYFASGTKSNWYAAFVQTNSLLDPAAGVSINGLSYGFPYSDQGGVSTNILFPLNRIPETITVNVGSPYSPSFVTQSLPDAIAGSAYRQTLVAGGSGIGANFAVSGGSLPGWLTLNSTTGVLSGTAPGSPTPTPYEFVIRITDSIGSTSLPFSFSVIDAEPVAPLTVAGLSNGNLYLPAADVNRAYSTQVRVTGGTGPYTLQLAPSVTLPTGLELGTLGTGAMTSSTGLFTLSGTQTQVYACPDVGFNVVVSDGTVAAATPTIGISLATVEINAAGTGYSVGDRFSVEGGGGSGAIIEVATVDGSGGIESFTLVNPGSGFTSAPTAFAPISVTGAGAALGLRGDRFEIVAVTVTNSGIGYSAAPTITISGGGAAEQSVTATLGAGSHAGEVVSISPPSGVYYTPAAGLPSIHIAPPSESSQHTFTMKLTVNPALAFATVSVPDAVLGQSYGQSLRTNQASEGARFAVTAGSLPPGLTLEPWGLLRGTPTEAGAFPFTVTATSAADGTASQAYNSFAVSSTAPAALAITTVALPPAVADVAYAQTIETSGGSGGDIAVALVNGALPDGLSLSSDGQISGTPGGTAAGRVAAFTVRAMDSLGNTAFHGYELGVLGVTSTTMKLAANATTLLIHGAGFDTTPANNTVALPGSGATGITITAATPTSLTIHFTGPLATGALQATVTVNGTTSDSTQVATVTTASTPTITASTHHLAANAATLTIHGTGFDASGQGTNIVSLSSGTVRSVTVQSATQLTVSVAGPLSVGPLTATVVTNGVSSISRQVAAVVAGGTPTINANARNLFNNSTTLTISGTGFDPSAAGTTELELSIAGQPVAHGAITVNSSTQMTVSGVPFTTAGRLGVLTAKVTINGVASQEVQVGTLLPKSTPVLALPTTIPNFAPNGTTLTLNGWGFTPGTVVTLQRNFGTGWVTLSGFTTTFESPNRIIITGLSLPAPSSGTGTLAATVSDPTNGSSGGIAAVGTVLTSARQVPTIVGSTVQISAGATTLIITGTGFDPNGTNIVALSSGGVALPPTAIASVPGGSGQDVTVSANGTQLTVRLAGPLPLGVLRASVVVDGVPMSGGPVQVATVVGPTITEAATSVSRSPTLLTIRGVGFSPTAANTVTLYTGVLKSQLPADTVVSVVADSTTQLTVVLNSASPLPAGALSAEVAVNGVSSGNPVQVANVAAAGPGIVLSPAPLHSDAHTLVVHGENFGATAGSNIVTLSTIAGPIAGAVKSVTINSTSQLTITLEPGLLTTGHLYATVTTAGVTSDTVLVANVVPAQPSAAASTVHVSADHVHVSGTIRVSLQAKDSLGRNVTTGGLAVVFMLAPGSAGGVFGPVTDHDDGTYSATFTSHRHGVNTFTASLNATQVSATAEAIAYLDLHALVDLMRQPARKSVDALDSKPPAMPADAMPEARGRKGRPTVQWSISDGGGLFANASVLGSLRYARRCGSPANVQQNNSATEGEKTPSDNASPANPQSGGAERTNPRKQREAAIDAVMREMAEEGALSTAT